MKTSITTYTAFNLTRKNPLVIILIFTGIIVFDSTIVKFSSYNSVEIPSQINFAIFVVFSIIFVAASAILINSVRKNIRNQSYKPTPPLMALRYLHVTITIILILTVAIILIITLQMILLSNYSLSLLRAQTYLSHLSPLIFLSFLIFLFGSWLKSKANYIIILYAISFSLVSANLIISLIYLELYFTGSAALPDMRPYPIVSYVTNSPAPQSSESLSTTFDALSLASFLPMWIATAILLSQYRYRMGRIKYFALMTIPLIYYIPFPELFWGSIFLFITILSRSFKCNLYLLT